MRSLPRPILHIYQLKSVRLPHLVQKPIASTILPLSLTSAVRQRIIKVLKCAFGQAVRWGMIAKNPFLNAILVKTPYHHRDIWDAATIRKALEACRDAQLYVAMNLSFACSMRLGEILGLTWNNVHIEPDDIAQDNAWLYVDKEVYNQPVTVDLGQSTDPLWSERMHIYGIHTRFRRQYPSNVPR